MPRRNVSCWYSGAVPGLGARHPSQSPDGEADDPHAHRRREPPPADAAVPGDLRRAGVRQHAGEGQGHLLEGEREVARRLVALVGVLLEAPARDPSHHRRARQLAGGEPLRLVVDDRVERLDQAAPAELPLAGEHLEQDRAEAEDVRAGVGGQPLDLLRRHVAGGPDDQAGLGGGRLAVAAAGGRLPVGELGEAEVEDLDPPVAGHEEVVRLEVAVHDALLVRRREAPRRLGDEIHGLADRDRAAAQPLAERLPLEQLGDEVRGAVDAARRRRRRARWGG